MGRAPCCDKEAKVKKGPWTPDEDLKLVAYIQEHGHGSWRALPEKAGLARCGKSCRLRWTNYLRPDIKRGRFTHEEEQTIFQFHAILGNRWSAIASRLPRRTDNEIKNYWNTHLKKRLNQVGIGPFSQTPASNLQDLLTLPWTPLLPTGLTHRTQWDLTVAEAQARLMPKLAEPQAEAAAVHPSAFFMGSWKTKVEDTLKPLQGFSVLDSVRPDTVRGDACHGSMPTTEDSGEGRSGVVSGSGSVLGDSPVNKRAWWPDTVLGAACNGAVEHSGEGRSGIYSGSVMGDQISPTSVLHGHDSYTDVHSPCGSINSGTTSDCFDIILHQSSSLEQFPVIRDQLEPSSSAPGTFWERQHVALMEALKPDSLVVLGDADSETDLESIIPLDFDEAEFPQFESLSEGTGQY